MLLQSLATYGASALGMAYIADGLGVVQTGGYLRLIFASRTDSRPGQMTLTSGTDTGSDLQPGSDIAVQQAGSSTRLYLFTTMGDMLRTNTLSNTGSFSGSPAASTSLGNLTGVTAVEVIERATGDLAILAQKNVAGLRVFALSDAGSLTLIETLADSAKSFIASVNDMARMTIGGTDFLLTLSATENGLTLYQIPASGGLTLTDAMGNRDGLAITGPAAVEVMQVDGQTYGVVASTGSSSLTAVRINALGVMFQTDHIVDDRDSRFAQASALDQFTAQGRSFMVAGGADAGLTVVELLPGGQLSKVMSVALETGQGLAAVGGIAVAVYGGMANIFVTDARGDRVQHFGIDLSGLGPLVRGSGVVAGTSGDDRLMGGAQSDSLTGGTGADFLHDGGGSDQMAGGAGADVYVMSADGMVDRIADFQQGADRIDLSDWGRIYSASALSIQATATGAVISYGAERLEVTSALGTGLVLTDSDFLF